MEYRNLGRTGVEVTSLCLGCMMFGAKTTPEDSYAIIDRALTHAPTAPSRSNTSAQTVKRGWLPYGRWQSKPEPPPIRLCWPGWCRVIHLSFHWWQRALRSK